VIIKGQKVWEKGMIKGWRAILITSEGWASSNKEFLRLIRYSAIENEEDTTSSREMGRISTHY